MRQVDISYDLRDLVLEVRRKLEEQRGKKFDDGTKLYMDYGHQDALVYAMLK